MSNVKYVKLWLQTFLYNWLKQGIYLCINPINLFFQPLVVLEPLQQVCAQCNALQFGIT